MENNQLEYYTINNKNTFILTKNSFTKAVESLLLHKHLDCPYCVVAIDVEHFNLINKWYGQQVGDELLYQIATCLHDSTDNQTTFAGYMFGDNFALFIPHDYKIIQHIFRLIQEAIHNTDSKCDLSVLMGIYVIDYDEMCPITEMYDKATLALNQTKGNYIHRIIYYKQYMQDQVEQEQRLLSQLQKSLKENKITYYIQPKCEIHTGKIVGGESLVRLDKTTSNLSPTSFIPLLERTGLIGKLDYYIWEKVCQDLHNALIQNKTTVPISINISRKDIENFNVVEQISKLCDKYKIPKNLLDIEITESAYSDNEQAILDTIIEFRKNGFKVAMDDFGSGYSSLNMLKNIDVDLLKIDMEFLNFKSKTEKKAINIIESIINMSRILEIPTIVEGVETKQQLELLKDLGCPYVQGYYYYAPLNTKEFYNLIQNPDNVIPVNAPITLKNVITIHHLIHNQLIDVALLDHLIGAFCFVEHNGQTISKLSGNELFYKLIQAPLDHLSQEKSIKQMLECIREEDITKVSTAFNKAKAQPDTCKSFLYHADYTGKELSYIMKIHFIRNTTTSSLYLIQLEQLDFMDFE